ncbi:hypothetical protein JKA74_14900 [Marivirga sp. S37H4]|uniref:Anti-sigma factor n=1 Tax=Marivirga aurantiaca TaxID=2802615 RepID=A0A934X0Q8_9BACT|nr:hypothetical protein [Marivirga aurantiaca]MBK6266332.1 hypothetical protein [Marivirga aurantiaca]
MKTDRDKLEDFIGKNRNAFEEDFNHEVSWDAIERKIKPKKKNSFNWLAAASIVLLLAVGWLIMDRYELNQKVDQLERLTVNGRSYEEIEKYYTYTIANKSQLVKEKSDQIDYPIHEDLNELQKNYESLKQQLKQGVPHQKIIDAMIWNLRTQIEILNEQLEILEEVQQHSNTQKNEKDEKHI